MQIEMQKLQSETKLVEARTEADLGVAAERFSRIDENKAMAVERRAQAVRDENAAVLDLVRAFKELDTFDIAHLKELMAMQAMIKSQEATVQNEIEVGSVKPSVKTGTVKKMSRKKIDEQN
jgi:hypothetical protein